MLLVASVPRLTLPMVAPPLPDVDGVCCKCKGAGLVVVRPLAHDREVCWAVEHNEGVLRQVDLVDLMEDLLPLARIRCRQFMCVEVMPRWSPDGKRLTYSREPHDSGQPSIMAVFVINANGGKPVVIATGGFYTHGTWQPNS